MEMIKEFVINVAVMIVFISAVDIISPNNQMKKYVKFVLGIIFIAVMINPIIEITTHGQNDIEQAISRYANEYNNIVEVNKNEYDVSETSVSKTFRENLENECKKIIEDKFKNLNVICAVKCTCDDKKAKYTISEVNVYVKNKDVVEIEKIDLSKEIPNMNKKYDYLVDFLKQELEIDERKINIYDAENN